MKIRQLIPWVTAVLVILVAAALIVCCVSINAGGERPFNREIVAEYAGKIAVPGWLCLAAVIAGLLLPGKADKAKALRDERDALARYSAELPGAKREQRLRRIIRGVTAAVIAGLAVYPVIYYLDAAHFTVANLSTDILRGVLVALIPTAPALALVYLCGRLERASISREIALYQTNGVKPGKPLEQKQMSPKTMTFVRCAVFAAAVALILLGIDNGGMTDVLGKAIRICTECIGLG